VIDCPRCGRENEQDARFCVGCGENLAAVTQQRERKDTYVGQVLEGKYLVLEHLGDGGMGKVYKAEQLTLNKIVAVKILHKTLLQNETQVKRFQREAWSASRLDHPNSIRIVDFGKTEENSHFIVMECLEGQELSKVIRDEFPLPAERIVHIMSQVLSVLQEAHAEHKIIHRDLKPDNIMLIKRAEDRDFVKVLDFGIAKLSERDASMPALTMQGIVCGTPEYMSPEQAMGQELDFRTDIYSAGCILYEMLTGQVPFVANNYQAILGMHIREEPTRPSVLRPDLAISPKVEEIALIAMSKSRDMRFPSALAMKNALEMTLRQVSEEAAAPPVQAVNRGGQTILMTSADVEYDDSSSIPEPPAPPAVSASEPPPSPIQRNTLAEVSPPVVSQTMPKPAAQRVSQDLHDDTDAHGGSSKLKIILPAVAAVAILIVVAVFALRGGEEAPTVTPIAEAPKEDPVEPIQAPTQAAPAVEPSAPTVKTAEVKPVESEIKLSSAAEKSKEVDKGAKESKPIATKESAVASLDDSAKIGPVNMLKALEFYEAGNKAYESGDFKKAATLYQKSRQSNPKAPSTYKKLGMTYEKLGKNREAKASYMQYLKLAPHAEDAKRIQSRLKVLD